MAVRCFYLDLVFFSFFFSLVFCGLRRLVDELFRLWVFLELCSISIIPRFFCGGVYGDVFGFYGALLTYIVVSGVSSILLMSGLLFSELYYFVYFGFVMKFGLFPFRVWVYRVLRESKWFFIFLLTVVAKFPVLFFCFLFQECRLYLVYGDCLFTILMCCCLFWFFRERWSYVWGHMSLSSVGTLIVVCFCRDVWLCFFIYFYYFVWAGFCAWFFCVSEEKRLMGGWFWFFCFVLLVTPLSFPLFYKLSVCVGLFYSSFYLLFGWALYRFSEQIFLYKLAGDYFYSGVFNVWL